MYNIPWSVPIIIYLTIPTNDWIFSIASLSLLIRTNAIIFLNKFLFIYLFLAVLGLRFCARAFSSCGEQGPLFIAVRGPSHYRGLSCHEAQAPDAQAQ